MKLRMTVTFLSFKKWPMSIKFPDTETTDGEKRQSKIGGGQRDGEI